MSPHEYKARCGIEASKTPYNEALDRLQLLVIVGRLAEALVYAIKYKKPLDVDITRAELSRLYRHLHGVHKGPAPASWGCPSSHDSVSELLVWIPLQIKLEDLYRLTVLLRFDPEAIATADAARI